MSVYSMTGYASAQHTAPSAAAPTEAKQTPTAQLGLEIRSVNSRFLDLSFRLPEDLRQWEPALRELLGARLKRGKIEVRASIDAQHGSVSDPSPKLLQRLNSLQDNFRSPVNMNKLFLKIQFPGPDILSRCFRHLIPLTTHDFV